MYMWEFGITQDHFPNPSNDKNKMTYHSRPGLDLTAKTLFLPIDKFHFSESGIFKKVTQLNV